MCLVKPVVSVRNPVTALLTAQGSRVARAAAVVETVAAQAEERKRLSGWQDQPRSSRRSPAARALAEVLARIGANSEKASAEQESKQTLGCQAEPGAWALGLGSGLLPTGIRMALLYPRPGAVTMRRPDPGQSRSEGNGYLSTLVRATGRSASTFSSIVSPIHAHE
uniref:Uncharacterized protein n=1 Tax=Thermogemmatispora argillosa TaxID=2045280 RepID=A0A455T5P9_9CHLR|nr:hypothetical protein KTA_29410 [Thermogemmatispora argillosa]